MIHCIKELIHLSKIGTHESWRKVMLSKQLRRQNVAKLHRNLLRKLSKHRKNALNDVFSCRLICHSTQEVSSQMNKYIVETYLDWECASDSRWHAADLALNAQMRALYPSPLATPESKCCLRNKLAICWDIISDIYLIQPMRQRSVQMLSKTERYGTTEH